MSSDRTPFSPQSASVKEGKPEPVSSKQPIQYWLGPFSEGVIEKPDGLAKITGPCGDSMEISLRVEGNKIIECQFRVDGCAVSRACASMAAALAKGKELEEAWDIDEGQIAVKLKGIPEDHRHCPVLARDTLRQAIEKYIKDRQ
ncbi:MAG: iron-sulfur cluster assembly scaffold protein [Deltaproteobacteria bacterium]|nr:iron-sulfur cluster assembly scaffold protein [Deltaproteobacteria bacterium]